MGVGPRYPKVKVDPSHARISIDSDITEPKQAGGEHLGGLEAPPRPAVSRGQPILLYVL